jgi:hypothetical protein
MYKSKDRKTRPLFEEFLPFGGQLEDSYASYFSDIGRPGLVVGLLLLKHMTDVGDEELVASFYENPYWQYFCGLEEFKKKGVLDPSSLSRLRKRLGSKYFKELEDKTYQVLIERKLLKARGMQSDS